MRDKSDLFSPVSIYPSTHPSSVLGAPFPESEGHVDYEDEFRAGKFIGARWLTEQSLTSALLFGYPGNGRHAFAKRLSRVLWQAGVDIVWVNTVSLSASDDQTLATVLRIVTLQGRRPTLLVLENIDSVVLTDYPQSVAAQVRGVLKNVAQSHRPVLVMATASSPSAATNELHSLGCVPHLFYFDWPSEARASEFFRLLKVPFRENVLKQVFEIARHRRVKYSANSLVIGASQLLRRVGSDINEREVQEIVTEITTVCSPIPESTVGAYESTNEKYIVEARQLLLETKAVPDPDGMLQEAAALLRFNLTRPVPPAV